jgi:mono/diheme cytochrome c family protein
MFSLLLALTACEVGIPAGTEPFYELNQVNMADQPKLKPQRADIFGSRGHDLIAPPEGVVARGAEPYPYLQEEAALAAEALRNPLDATPEVLTRGEKVHADFCQVCHGPEGAGDGPLTRLFPAPPSLMRQRVRDYTDGRVFHVPMRGQGSMPSYAKQVEPQELWAAVHHLRKLQALYPVAPPTEADLQAMKALEEKPLNVDAVLPSSQEPRP